MLSERDREALRALEEQLERDDPAFVEAFARGTAVEPRRARERRLYTIGLVVAVLLGLSAMLVGAWEFVPAAAVATGLLALGRRGADRSA